MRPFSYIKTNSPKEALAKKNANAQYLAGGSNLVELLKKSLVETDQLIDITSSISNQINFEQATLKIGAMCSNSAIANHKIVLEKFPLLAKAILAGASPQIRNMATAGGNLLQRTRCPYFHDLNTPCNKRTPNTGCSAIGGENRMSAIVGYSSECVAVHPSDMCIALAALDAKIDIMPKNGAESTINFNNFHRLPNHPTLLDNNLPADAIITKITIDENPFHKNCAYVKLRDRESYAFALVSVAAALELDGKKIVNARLASGGVAHKPWRWTAVEQFLIGKNIDQKVFTAAAELAIKDLKPLANNSFKIPLLKGAIETALQQCIG